MIVQTKKVTLWLAAVCMAALPVLGNLGAEANAQTRGRKRAPAPKRKAAPAPKRGAAPTAFRRNAGAREQMKRIFAGFEAHGFAAVRGGAKLMKRGSSRVGAVSKDLGKLLSVEKIITQLRSDVSQAKTLPGDPWVMAYQQWKEARAKKEPVPNSPPGALKDEDLKAYDTYYVKRLIPDLRDYVPFIYDVVFARVTPGERPKDNNERAELLYQYGCRQISRLMPSFARIVRKKIKNEIDLVGGWDERISQAALDKDKEGADAKGGKASKPTEYKPPVEEELVEECTVTHRQLEETLKKDLKLLVAATRQGAAAPESGELIQPLSGFPEAFKGAGGFAAPAAGTAMAQRPSGGGGRMRRTRNTNHAGGDYRTLKVGSANDCSRACEADGRCRGFTFVKASRTCFLKNNIAPGRPNNCCDSGVKGAGLTPVLPSARHASVGQTQLPMLGGHGRRRPQSACSGIGKIVVTKASVAHNCDRRHHGNLTGVLARLCNGKATCSYKVPRPEVLERQHRLKVMGFMDLCSKAFDVDYHCGDNKPRNAHLDGWAWDRAPAQLSCHGAAAAAQRETAQKKGQVTLEDNVDRIGGDYRNVRLPSGTACRDACALEDRCRAFTYWQGTCFLKASIPQPSTKQGMVSGVRVVLTVHKASVGHNCDRKHIGNMTKIVRDECAGKLRCMFRVPRPEVLEQRWNIRVMGFADLCSKAFDAEYDCGDGQRRTAHLDGWAWDKAGAELSCEARMEEARAEASALATAWAKSPGRNKISNTDRRMHGELFKDIGEAYSIKELTGETFNEVANRLLFFYRKAGSSRNFELALKSSKKDVQKMAGAVKTEHAPPKAKEEMGHQASAGTVETRTRRELLRRRVEQWTYGYEYEQLAASLQSRGRVVNDYKNVERAVLKDFWTDCEELKSVCQTPKTAGERNSCAECAEVALYNHCIDGKEGERCKGATVVRVADLGKALNDGRPKDDWEKNGAKDLSTTSRPNGNTLLNWLAMKTVQEARNPVRHRGTTITGQGFENRVIRALVSRIFLPDEVNEQKGLSTEGKQLLDALPVTSWQRCVLFNPFYRPGSNVCDSAKGGMEAFKKAKNAVPWHQAKLFSLVLDDPAVKLTFREVKKHWGGLCRNQNWCRDRGREADEATRELFGGKGAGGDQGPNMSQAGDAMANTLGPIVGKLLGMLLKAAGMYEMMKTLARAGGITPEQSADCEDPEYRHGVMSLGPCRPGDKACQEKDTKRGCLLKVFAKNFTTVLESIIIMLGEKLVDWGVDMLRTLLQPVKSALLSAAGSVPFAGGVLATIVDIAWELLMNYGAKMLLKGFVIAKLPEWLQIKKLANMGYDELVKEPIVAAVIGIIVELIESAVTYGDKGWMAVGAQSLLGAIQSVLQAKGEWFWYRALSFAKKELAKGAASDRADLGAQAVELVKSMVKGFGAVVSRQLPACPAGGDGASCPRTAFETAIEEVVALFDPSKLGDLVARISRDPVGTIVGFLADKVGPVVLPVVAALVPLPDWAKGMLTRIGTAIKETVDEIKNNRVDAAKIVGRIVDVFEPVALNFLGQLPISDQSLKDMVRNGFTGLASALKNINTLESTYLRDPWRIVKAMVDLTGDFLKAKVGELITDPNLAPEKALLQTAVETILEVLGDSSKRQQLFGASGPNVNAILSKLADILSPYAQARLRGLVAGSGLEDLVGGAAEALFGPEGPFKRGAAFFTSLPQTLATRGQAIAGQALGAVSGVIDRELQKAGAGPVVGGLVRGVLGAVTQALRSPEGIAGLARSGAAGILRLVKDAAQPLLASLVPEGGGGPLAALAGVVRGALGGVFDLFGDPAALSQLASRGAAALGSLATRVAGSLKDAVKSLVGGAVQDADVRGLAEKAIDGLFGLLGDATRAASFSGAQVVNLLKEVGAAVFSFVKGKVTAALASLNLGPAQGILTAVLDEAEQIVADPSRLRALVDGGAQALIARLAGVLRPAAESLIDAVVPAQVKDTIKTVAGEIVGFLSNPSSLGSLGSISASDLIGKLAPVAHSLLTEILRSAVPADAFAAVQTAIGQVQAALANPAGLAAAAGEAARTAIDQTIAAVLLRIPDEGLRELASNLVALVRDLATGEGAAAALRTQAKALLERMLQIGTRYIVRLIPAGPAQEIAGQALDGLRAVLTNPSGVAQGLAQRAQALLPGVIRTVTGVLRSALVRAIPDATIAGVVGTLVDEVAGLIGDPTRWRSLTQQGLGFLLSRVLPVGRDFAVSMLGRVGGAAGGLMRDVVESLLNAATRLLSGGSLATFAQNAASSLLSLGVSAVGPAVVGLVERAGAGDSVVAVVRQAFTDLADVIADPQKIQAFLRLTPAQAFGKLLGPARQLTDAVIARVISDAGLRSLAQEGAKGVLDLVERAVGGAGNLGEGVKALLARLVTPITTIAKDKLLGLFPSNLGALKSVLSAGFDKLASFSTSLLQQGQAAWTRLVGDGSRLFGDLVAAVLPLVKDPIEKAVTWAPLKGLLTRLLDQVAALLADPAKLIRDFGNAQTAMRALLPKLAEVMGPFAHDVLVKPLPVGLPQDVVKAIVDGGLSFLREPAKLDTFIRSLRNTNDAKVIVRKIIAEIVPGLLGSLPGGRGGALFTVFCNGLDLLMVNLLGGTAGQMGCSAPRTASR